MQSLKKQYTHFLSLPFLREHSQSNITILQNNIFSAFMKRYNKKQFSQNRSTLTHVSLCMLTLQTHQLKKRAEDMLTALKEDLHKTLDNTVLTFSKLGYFTRYNYERKKNEVSIIYLNIEENQQFYKVLKATDIIIRALLKEQIINESELKNLRIRYSNSEKLYRCQNYHLTLFRLKDVEENQEFKTAFSQISYLKSPLRFQLDFLDISTRFSYQSTGFYRPLNRIVLQSHS